MNEEYVTITKREYEHLRKLKASNHKRTCYKCEKYGEYTIAKADNMNTYKKMCCLCKECYSELLDYLGLGE